MCSSARMASFRCIRKVHHVRPHGVERLLPMRPTLCCEPWDVRACDSGLWRPRLDHGTSGDQGNQIGDRGLASLLAEPMQGVLPSLHYIYLESNLLTDSGLAALASLRFAARLCRHSTSFTCPAIPRARRHRRPCSQASQQPCSSRDGLDLVLIECPDRCF